MNRRWSVPGVAALMLSAVSSFAQPPIGIHHAVYVPQTATTPAHVELVLTAPFETPAAVAAARDKAKYRIVDLYSGPGRSYAPKDMAINRAVVPSISLLPPESLNTVQLVLSDDLPAVEEERYILIVSGLSIGTKNIAVTATPTPVTLRMVKPGPLAPQWGKAKDKDSSDVYFSGSISRSAAKDFYGNADVKIRYPIFERPIRSRLHTFAPSFDLAASENPDADPDSLRLGFVWQFFPIQASAGAFPITRWENAVEHEASRDFDYRTLVWRSEWLLLPKPWRLGDGGAWVWINPIAGFAAGRILEAPAGTLGAGALFRLLGGVSATLEVPTIFAKTLSISGQYQARKQWQEELAGTITLGKGSHSWTSIKAEIALNDLVSVGAVFQDGEQPPKYNAVHRSLTFDLTFKAARQNKPQ